MPWGSEFSMDLSRCHLVVLSSQYIYIHGEGVTIGSAPARPDYQAWETGNRWPYTYIGKCRLLGSGPQGMHKWIVTSSAWGPTWRAIGTSQWQSGMDLFSHMVMQASPIITLALRAHLPGEPKLGYSLSVISNYMPTTSSQVFSTVQCMCDIIGTCH